MSTKKHEENLETIKNEILAKAKDILNIKGQLGDEDKTFIQFLNYIFKNEFKTNSLDLVCKDNKKKSSLNCIRKYIQIIHEIFKYDYNKRKELYSSDVDTINNNIIISKLKELKFLFKKMKKDIPHEYSEERKIIYNNLDEILSKQKPSLFSFLDHYQIYFCYFLSDPDILRFIFYKVYKSLYISKFGGIDLKHYYANLNKKTCLDLIISFLKDFKINKKNCVIVYTSIIFNYDLLFVNELNTIIDKKYIDSAINKTYAQIEEIPKKNINSVIHIFLTNLKKELCSKMESSKNEGEEKNNKSIKLENGNNKEDLDSKDIKKNENENINNDNDDDSQNLKELKDNLNFILSPQD